MAPRNEGFRAGGGSLNYAERLERVATEVQARSATGGRGGEETIDGKGMEVSRGHAGSARPSGKLRIGEER